MEEQNSVVEVIELRNVKTNEAYLVSTNCPKSVLILLAEENMGPKHILDYDCFFEEVQKAGYTIKDGSMEIISFGNEA